MSLLNHIELKIVKGIGPVPGHANSAEQPLVVLNLLDSGAGGISVTDWTPNIPQFKSGIWAESPITPGRDLTAAEVGNVTETMKLTVRAGTSQALAAMLSNLAQMAQDAKEFHISSNQTEPVYLKWYASCGAGPEYALIYLMNFIPAIQDAALPTAEITLTIEREYGWRGIPPGYNPKAWALQAAGSTLNNNNASLASASGNLLAQTIQNRREWNTTQTALISQNYVDIPGSQIPGDLPAKACIVINPTTPPKLENAFFVGCSSKPTSAVGRTGQTVTQALVLNAGDVTGLDADCSIEADTGAPASNSSANGQRGKCIFTIATARDRFTWTTTGSPKTPINGNLLRGRFIAFVRARLSAAGTVTLNLSTSDVSGLVPQRTPDVTLTDAASGGTGNTTYWNLVYLGVVSIPFSERRIPVSIDGLGVANITPADLVGEITIALRAARTSGTPNLYVADVILIPIDECAGNWQSVNYGNTVTNAILDNTSYFMHGDLTGHAEFQAAAGASIPVQYTGQEISLSPGVNNRLHFILYNADSLPALYSSIGFNFSVYINIVPRWSGIRDV